MLLKLKQYLKSFRYHISRHVFAEALLKKNGLKRRAHEIEILAMGSSHCTRGFDPNLLKNAYNLGVMDQDLYTTHWLFNHYINSLKSLKHLILFYSMHSQGHELAKTKSFKTMAIHHSVFGVPYPVKEVSKWTRAIKHRFKTFNDTNTNYDDFNGYILDVREIRPVPVEFRVFHHLKENKRPSKQNYHIFDIGKECKKRGIKLCIVIAPVRSDFIKELRKSNLSDKDLFDDIFMWCRKNNVPILRELRSSNYHWDDFLDSDHLNPKGAKKLTKKIAKLIHLKTNDPR